MHQTPVFNAPPVCILIHKTQSFAKIVHWGIMPKTNKRMQTSKCVMMLVYLVQEDCLVKKKEQRISWKGVKIVPVVDFLNMKARMTAPAKGAQKENGVLKLVLKRNPSASIASLGHMV